MHARDTRVHTSPSGSIAVGGWEWPNGTRP